MKVFSQLSIFQSYDAYHTTAAQRPLNHFEKQFYRHCMEHHAAICDTNLPTHHPILKRATKLFCDIP
jgi:hypothetical protein